MLRTTVAGAGLAVAIFSAGCSIPTQYQGGLRLPAVDPDYLASHHNNSLAAADALGMIVFGGAPTVTDSTAPNDWTLANAGMFH